MKKIIVLFLAFLITIGISFAQNEKDTYSSHLGLIRSIEYLDIDINNTNQTNQIAEIELLNGDYKGEVIKVDNILSGNPQYDISLKKGMKVILHSELNDNDLVFYIVDIKRSDTLLLLSFIFCSLLIYVGKKKGLYSLVSIILTCVLIFYLLSPMILFGINPILATIFICLASTAITIYFVGGFNRKSTSAILGCISSLLFATILSLLTVKIAHLNGYTSEEVMFLFSAHPELDFIAISISTIILATLGAVMDVAMSIASTINEIYSIDNSKTVKELFNSGMNVGRDIIGTMANTLILVYLGASLPLILLANNLDVQKFCNLNPVVTEIASALIGSCAIIVCVPITALIASELIKHIPEKFDFSKLGK